MTDFVGEDFLAAIRQYAEEANNAVYEAAQVGFEHLVESTQAAARQHARWAESADHIKVWSDDGRVWLGIQNQDVMSEAQAAEFGDQEHPPISIIRASRDAQVEAAQVARERMRNLVGGTW